MVYSQKIDISKAIKPTVSENGEPLELPYLVSQAKLAKKRNNKLVAQYIATKRDSLDRLDSLEAIERNMLIEVANRVYNAKTKAERAKWSQRFTQISITLYGTPDKYMARKLLEDLHYRSAKGKFRNTEQAVVLSDLLNSFNIQPIKHPKSLVYRNDNVNKSLRLYIRQNYKDQLNLFIQFPKNEISAKDLKGLFEASIKQLSANDKNWGDWAVEHDNTGGLSVDASSKKIIIGKKRVKMSKEEAMGLFFHEIIVHAQRGMNGYKKNERLGIGLPGYLTADEGLGVLFEFACTNNYPKKIIHRYTDIALALGAIGKPISRAKLVQLFIARDNFMNLEEGLEVRQDAKKRATVHVSRIFKGTGNRKIGVYTKDIVYFEGYNQVINILNRAFTKGGSKAVSKKISYLLKAKFNPKDSKHIKYLQNAF